MEKVYLRDVLGLVWGARFFMLCSVVVCLFAAIILYLDTPPQYEAEMTLVPTRANQYALQGMGAGQGVAGSVAGLLGMGNDKDTQSIQQFVELMRSPYVVTLIDRKSHIISHIFASQWDSTTNQWIRPSGWSQGIKDSIKSMLHRPLWQPPGAFEASAQIETRTTIDSSPLSGIVRISLRDKDPAYAAFLLNSLYEATDGLLRERAKQRSDEHIAYIQQQLASVNYTENRQSLTALLTAELSQQLLINSNAPFVLEKLSPITQPPFPVSPKLMTFIVAAVFGGLMIGFALALADRRFMLNQTLRAQWNRRVNRRLS